MRTSVAVNMCINCRFFTLIFAVFLLISSPISCRLISTVNQTFNFLVVNLCLTLVRKVGLIAISFISFGNWNFHIYNRVRLPDDSWFNAVCNIYNEFSSRFVWSLRNEIWLAQWLYTGRQARTGGMYYVPNTHRTYCVTGDLNSHKPTAVCSMQYQSLSEWCCLCFIYIRQSFKNCNNFVTAKIRRKFIR